MGIPMLKIRRSQDRLIFNMGIPILVRRYLYIEMAPSSPKGTGFLAGLVMIAVLDMSLPIFFDDHDFEY